MGSGASLGVTRILPTARSETFFDCPETHTARANDNTAIRVVFIYFPAMLGPEGMKMREASAPASTSTPKKPACISSQF